MNIIEIIEKKWDNKYNRNGKGKWHKHLLWSEQLCYGKEKGHKCNKNGKEKWVRYHNRSGKVKCGKCNRNVKEKWDNIYNRNVKYGINVIGKVKENGVIMMETKKM